MPRYVAVKDKRNQSDARDYCTSTKFNGTLCRFQNQSDWQKIVELIKTVECNESSQRRYWTDLKFVGGNVVFMNGKDTVTVNTVNITGNLTSKCVVANGSGLQGWPCTNKEYFICDTAQKWKNTQGIYVNAQL